MFIECGRSYDILYVAGTGESTRRTIDVLWKWKGSDGLRYLRAYCHLRGAERVFRVDRILVAHHAGRKPPRQAGGAAPARGLASLAGPFAVLGLVAILAFSWAREEGIIVIPAPSSSISPAPQAKPPARKATASSLPAVTNQVIGGMTLRTITVGSATAYLVVELGLVTDTRQEAIVAIRVPRFIRATGLDDRDLVNRYLAADLDGSGKLSWEELRRFQAASYRGFAYRANKLALDPASFLKEGGGDCEDFALWTAGLLRFWGWVPWLASFGPADGGSGHALCFSYEEGSIPAGYTYFSLENWRTEGGESLPDGRYVPIDYDEVGALSDAIESGWKLRAVHRPEDAWGEVM